MEPIYHDRERNSERSQHATTLDSETVASTPMHRLWQGTHPRLSNLVGRQTAPSRTLFRLANRPPRPGIPTGLYTTAFVLSTGLLAIYYLDARSAFHRYLLTPVLRNLFDAETGHKIAVKVLRSGLGPRDPVADDPCLKVEVRQNSFQFMYSHLNSTLS